MSDVKEKLLFMMRKKKIENLMCNLLEKNKITDSKAKKKNIEKNYGEFSDRKKNNSRPFLWPQ